MEGDESETDIEWTVLGRDSFARLVEYLRQNEYGDAAARAQDIRAAINALRRAPSRCQVAYTRGDRAFRRLIVRGRYLVYYIYLPPTAARKRGCVSIRGVKHGARRRPFAGVRDSAAAQRGSELHT